ncbi:MAG: hypothetical protein JWM43_1003 [Acidobacteriaceae bacterium]|nr:hypothetical protein [Acidobacteriaceae bacterium]
MMRVLGRWSVLGALISGMALAQVTPTPSTSGAQATVTYQFDRTGLPVPRFTLVIHEDGTGTYHAEEVERRSADSALQQVSLKVIDRPLTVSAETATKVFAAARALKFFDIFCGTKAKNIADTGKKTLSYKGSDGTGSCVYNYSDDKSVMALTDSFYAIAYTMDVGRRLDFERRFDRLGLDAELISLEKAAQDKNALELGNIAPTLRVLAGDGELMQRVRTRAGKLLEQSSAATASK